MVFRAHGKRGHREVLGGNRMKFSPVQKGRFPPKLVDYLLGVDEECQEAPIITPLHRSEEKISVEEREVGETIQIPPHQLKERNSFFVGAISFEEEEMQLIMAIVVSLQNNEKRVFKILIDTGAQINLIRKDMVPEWMFTDAPEKINLRTVSGQRLAGGERQVDLMLGFRQVLQGETMPDLRWEPATFYEADIRVDAILSHPWMVETKIGVFPHLRAMAVSEPEITLLMGLPKKRRTTKRVDGVQNWGNYLNGGRRQNRWNGNSRNRWNKWRRNVWGVGAEKDPTQEAEKKWVPVPELVEKPWDSAQEKHYALEQNDVACTPGRSES